MLPSKPSEFWRCGRCGTPNPLASYLPQCVACGAPRGEGTMLKTPAPSAPTTGPASSAPARRASPWLKGLSLAYLAWLVILLLIIRTLGDLWAPATALLFLPRLVWIAPIPLLGWWTWRRGARWLWLVQGFSLFLVLGPIMNFHLPVGLLFQGPAPPDHLRVLTLNQGGDRRLDFATLKQFLETERINVLCLQEGPGADGLPDPRLVKMLSILGWKFARSRMIASRLPILDEQTYKVDSFPEYGFWDVRIYQLDVQTRSGRKVRVASIHMPTVRVGFQKLFRGDIGALDRLNRWRAAQFEVVLEKTFGDTQNPVVVAGDFNTPPESRLLDPLRASGQFAFEQAGLGYGYTRPSWLSFVQIDHIAASPEWIVERCAVGPHLDSDHLPLFADLALPAPVAPAR